MENAHIDKFLYSHWKCQDPDITTYILAAECPKFGAFKIIKKESRMVSIWKAQTQFCNIMHADSHRLLLCLLSGEGTHNSFGEAIMYLVLYSASEAAIYSFVLCK